MSQKAEPAVIVKDLYKSFRLPHEQHSGLKQLVLNMFRRKHNKGYETQKVLNDISFEIKKGEFFGIVGRNGSGKSTLLKLLAGIYAPDSGLVHLNGSLTPFIELGVGFNPELTGRENVFLNGALLGFSKSEMEAMYNDIVEFAELEKFMDQKLKNYSSGMQVRLAFSIAIRAKSDILLIDEVLAVGDADFQQKCYRYFDQLKREKRTIILVSHDMGAVKQFCDKAILLSKGKLVASGAPDKVALEYERLNFSKAKPSSKPNETPQDPVTINISDGKEIITSIESGKKAEVTFTWDEEYKVSNIGVLIFKNQELVFATNSFNVDDGFIQNNTAKIKLEFPLGDGRYRIRVGLFGEGGQRDLIGIFGDEVINVFGARTKNDQGDDIEGIRPLPIEWTA